MPSHVVLENMMQLPLEPLICGWPLMIKMRLEDSSLEPMLHVGSKGVSCLSVFYVLSITPQSLDLYFLLIIVSVWGRINFQKWRNLNKWKDHDSYSLEGTNGLETGSSGPWQISSAALRCSLLR